MQDALKHQSTTPVQGGIRKMSGYGYAWNVGEYRNSGPFAGHGGGYVGYMAFVALLPDKKSGAAVFVNMGATGGGFGTIVLIDVIDRLLGLPVDEALRKNYENATVQLRKRISEQKPIAPNPAMSGQLLLSPEAYVGRYHNDLFGNIYVRFSGGSLKMDWDDLPQLLKSAGMDEFTAHTDASDATKGRFVPSGKKCVGVELEVGGKKVMFSRR